jgi:hypothetical protein
LANRSIFVGQRDCWSFGRNIPAGANDWAESPSVNFGFSLGDVQGTQSHITAFPDVEDTGFRSEESFCLAIQSKESPPSSDGAWASGSKNVASSVEGLVLQSVGQGAEEFRRIGLFLASDSGAREISSLSDDLEEHVVTIV